MYSTRVYFRVIRVVYKAGEKLYNAYEEDFSNDLPNQLIRLKYCLKNEIGSITTIKQLAELLIIDSPVSSSFPDVCTACILSLTMTVTVVEAERSFSKQKIIKTYLRSSMGQERLRSLSLLSIENNEARKLNVKSIIDIFSEEKVRKKSF